VGIKAASVALIDHNRVLLIERAHEPLRGLWTLPGGRLTEDESPESGAIREVREELGVAIETLWPVTTIEAAGYELFVFASRRFAGEIAPSAEIAAWQWLTRAETMALATSPGLDDVLRLALSGRA
jgi:8-oxo-dGTP diphosphatase